MYQLIAPRGRWAYKSDVPGKYVYKFGNMIWVGMSTDLSKYTLLEEDSEKEIPLEKPITDYLVEYHPNRVD